MNILTTIIIGCLTIIGLLICAVLCLGLIFGDDFCQEDTLDNSDKDNDT